MDIKLIVIDPERIRRRLACDAAATLAGLRVVAEFSSVEEACRDLEADADLFLVNATLLAAERPALDDLARGHAGACFVLFGTQPDLNALILARHLPVHGFLSLNHLSAEEFSHALEVIAFGGAVIEPACAQLLLDYIATLPLPAAGGRNDIDLSEREREVLDFVRAGLSNKEIALRLRISLGTVRAHLRSVFRKLDVRSRAAAAALAMRLQDLPVAPGSAPG